MSVVIDKKQHSIDELAALFVEIEVGKNLDVEDSSEHTDMNSTGNLRSFADKCKDVQAVMEHENVSVPETETETELEANPASPVVAQSEPDLESHPDVLEKQDTVMTSELENPLELNSIDLKAYQQIQEKYPQFVLYDGSQAFKEFYRYKVRSLKGLLTSYPVLDIKDMNKETLNIRTKYQGSGDLPDPVAIGIKMSECQIARGRLTTLMMKAQMQYPAWRKAFEWLNAKIYKDHELKGQHKREGQALEHNDDMKIYCSDLQGFLDAATQLDNFLKSIHDSLSRQLTCVIIRDKSGMAHDTICSELNQEVNEQKVNEQKVQPDSGLDGLDTIEHGTVIPKSRVGGLVQRDFAGAEIEDDVLQDIG